MEKEEIKAAILHALERGESLNDAVVSLINAGYNREAILAVANEILLMQKRKTAEKVGEKVEKEISKVEALKVEVEKRVEKTEEKITEKYGVKRGIEEQKEEKKEITKAKFDFSRIKFFLLSLIFILYYLIILVIKYKNWISLVWILFGLPYLIINIALIINQNTKKITNEILVLINLIAFIGLIIFNLVMNFKNFFEVLVLLFTSPYYWFIFPAFILAYLLNLFGLIERIKES